MPPPSQATKPTGGSFLPEDYLQKKAEKRAIAISLILFLVVTVGIGCAYFVTARSWFLVRSEQERVNEEYAIEAKKIEQLKSLEAQKTELTEKADVTMALRERVPRSVLMAEVINRMPQQLSLTDVNLKSKRIIEAPKPKAPAQGTLSGSPVRPAPAPGTPGATAEPAKPIPPKYEFTVELQGLSATDEDVADYHQSLTQCPLLDHVEMISSGEVIVDEVSMRKWRIEARIRDTADARSIEPLHVPRLGNRPVYAANPKKEGQPASGAKASGQKGKNKGELSITPSGSGQSKATGAQAQAGKE